MINISDKALNKNLLSHRGNSIFNQNLNVLSENFKFLVRLDYNLLPCKKVCTRFIRIFDHYIYSKCDRLF